MVKFSYQALLTGVPPEDSISYYPTPDSSPATTAVIQEWGMEGLQRKKSTIKGFPLCSLNAEVINTCASSRTLLKM